MDNDEMDIINTGLLNEFSHYKETSNFYDSPYSGSGTCFVAFGIDVECNIDIFKQFDITTFINSVDENDLKLKYNAVLEKFKADMIKLPFWNDLHSEEVTLLNEILEREPKLYFYFGTS